MKSARYVGFALSLCVHGSFIIRLLSTSIAVSLVVTELVYAVAHPGFHQGTTFYPPPSILVM